MPSQLTVTAKTGPASQITAGVIGPDVTNINFDLARRVVTMLVNSATGPSTKEFDLVGTTVTTFTISGANYTMVIS